MRSHTRKHRRRQRSRDRKRSFLLTLYESKCFWCSGDLPDAPARNRMTFDELLPRSRGGRQVLSNQVPSCPRCNLDRSNMVAPKAAIERHHAKLIAAGIEIEPLDGALPTVP